MRSLFVSRVGGILSADIAVPEHEKQRQFYARVLGTGEKALWRDDLMNSDGIPVIGLGERRPEYASLPLQWMPHVQVADVAASARRAAALGGTELVHGKDDAGNSQWAVLLDPNGAGFGLIPVVPENLIPARDDDPADDAPASTGFIAWVDMTVPNASDTRDFYREVIGWSAEDVAMKDAGETYADYNMIGGDGKPAAGICHARGVNADLPPVWMIYLPVGDLAESLRRVETEGGEVIKVLRGADERLVYAAVRDPLGVCFALVPT